MTRAQTIFEHSRRTSRARCGRGTAVVGLIADGTRWRVEVRRESAGGGRVEQYGLRRRSETHGAFRRTGWVRLPLTLVVEAYLGAVHLRGVGP